MLKLEQLDSFLGFGEGESLSEYYFSVGMRHIRGGIEPGWRVVKSSDSSTVSTGSGYGLVQEFTERLESSVVYNYAVDENGIIAKVQALLNTWTRIHIPGTSSSGNGLITDHSSSQRLIYIQDEWVGSYDGIVWYDTFMDLGWSLTIKKSPDIYEDWVVIPNGSTVALLNITDDSKNYAAFTFPANFECTTARSGANGVLLGANFNNQGVLVLWDCQLDRSLAPWLWLNGTFAGISKYNGIWVVATNREIILTNGYSILKTYPIPDIGDIAVDFGPTIPSGMKVDENKLFIGASTIALNRRKKGIFVLDLITGLWEFAPLSDGNLYSNSTTGAIFINSKHRRLVSHGDSFISPNQDYIGRIRDAGSNSHFIIKGGSRNNKKKKAEALILNLGIPLRETTTADNLNWNIIVKLYNFDRVLWGSAQAKIASTDKGKITINDTVYNLNAQVGDEVTVLEGLNAGEIRHIVSMTGAGTATEVWTLDSDFSELTESGAWLNVSPFKKVGGKTVTTFRVHNDRLFIPIKKSIIGRKFLIKVICKTGTIHISSLGFVYDELTV